MKKNNLHTKKIFEKDYGDRDWNWYRNLVAECVKYGMPGRWLDLGAGLGLLVECAQRFGIDCIGLEGSEYGVKAAKERFPDIDMRQHFLEDKFPFEDKSISTVVAHQIIEHVCADTARFMLRESFRVLKPGGYFYLLTLLA